MTFTGKLRDFQLDAYDLGLDRNSLIAYDKGLGKTVVSTAIMETLIEERRARTGLVVVPASLKYQWQRKVKEFTDGALVHAVGDTKPDRLMAYRRYDEGQYDYLILSYNNVVDEWDTVHRLPRDFVILDEATFIKGFKSKRSKRIKSLTARIRLGLSGQPLENRPEEVFSIMQYIDRGVLGSPEYFEKAFIARDGYGKVQYYRNLDTLHRILREVMARKTWTDPDVRDEMPSVEEQVIEVPFDPAGARLYNKIRNELLTDLREVRGSTFDIFSYYGGYDAPGGDNRMRGQIMQKVTALRMLCDNPMLLKISADRFAEWSEEQNTKVQQGSRYAAMLNDDGHMRGVQEMPKMDAVLDYIDKILGQHPRNKIVLFSYFKPTVFMFQDALLDEYGTHSVVYHGDMTPRAKDAAAMRFAHDPECRVFVATDAGGYGLDIPEANYLINYDLPWSAGALGQRNGRIMRLSSEFDTVHFVTFLMANSIEVRQYDMLEQKNAIAKAALDGVGIDQYGKLNMDLGSLREFLESAA